MEAGEITGAVVKAAVGIEVGTEAETATKSREKARAAAGIASCLVELLSQTSAVARYNKLNQIGSSRNSSRSRLEGLELLYLRKFGWNLLG